MVNFDFGKVSGKVLQFRFVMHDIHETEEKLNSGKTVIIGDMNEMPYAKGCLNAFGLHGLPVLREDDRPGSLSWRPGSIVTPKAAHR